MWGFSHNGFAALRDTPSAGLTRPIPSRSKVRRAGRARREVVTNTQHEAPMNALDASAGAGTRPPPDADPLDDLALARWLDDGGPDNRNPNDD